MATYQVDLSQIYGGGGNSGTTYTNDYIELYNYGTTDVNISGWSVQYASATGTSWQVTNLTGTIAAGHYYLVQEAMGAGGTTMLPTPDATGVIAMSATAGKVALSTSTTAFTGSTPTGAALVDFVGYGTTANASETSPAPAPSNTTADIRTPSGTDTNNNSKDFTTGAPMPRNSSVAGTQPAGTTNVSIADATYVNNPGGTETETFTVTRSDTTGSFSFNYATADGSAKAGTDYTAENGTVSFAAGGAATQTISVPLLNDATPPNPDTFTVNLTNLASTSGTASFSKANATGTIVTPTPIYTIQGTGFTSPLVGETVTTDGVVTAIASNGYYLQDAKGDGNTATSDGLFVFTSSAPKGVAVGDFNDVSGTVQEYTPSGAAAFSTTELSNVTATTTISHNNALPAAVVIGTDGVLPPNTTNGAANFFESLEGMRVTVENPVTIGPDNAQYGEIEAYASNGAGDGLNARGDALISLGQTSFGNTDTVGGNFNPERIEIDGHLTPSGTTNYVPDVSLGTHFNNVTGILNYDFGQFGVSSTAPITVAAASTIQPTVTTLVADPIHLTVASYNIANFSSAYQGQAKVDAVAGQIVNALKSPDIISLQEVQDDSGPTPDAGQPANPNGDNGTTVATQNLAALVKAINAQGGPQYTAIDNPFIGNDTNGGQPGGNIRDAFLYRADQVQFVPGSLATIAANGSAIHDMGSASADAAANMDQQVNNNNPFYASRPPLSANFTYNGQTVTVIDDHFTSKGGSGNLTGPVQPPFDGGEVQRAAQAQAENTYVNSLLGANPNANIVITGDLNEFNNEEPIRVLEGAATISNYSVPAGASASTAATATYNAGGTPVLTDLEGTLPADQQYDYLFEGNAESLVHVLSSNALTPGAQFQAIHVNSEFADQTSDHDPLVASFALAPVCFVAGTLIATARGEVAVEALHIGDLVATVSGALRPIRWLGHRAVDCRRHPAPRAAMPVRIAEHAIEAGKPGRDLWVSPGHAICIDDVLIPAVALVNGTTVTQERVDSVTYWHLELESHDVILAEGLPAESYIDCGNRDFFVEEGTIRLDGSPDMPARTTADYCRPFHAAGECIEVARKRMQQRAEAFGWAKADAIDLHLLVDDIRVEPVRRGQVAVFAVSASACEVWLVSGTSRPIDVTFSLDERGLGVCVGSLTIADGFETRVVAASDPRLVAGFHQLESEGAATWRWTDGRAHLPNGLWRGCEGTLALRIDFHHAALPRWLRSAAVVEATAAVA